jgi:hypothetical protein
MLPEPFLPSHDFVSITYRSYRLVFTRPSTVHLTDTFPSFTPYDLLPQSDFAISTADGEYITCQ